MEDSELDIEKIVCNKFIDALKESELITRPQDKWKTPILIRRFDIVIYKEPYPLAVIEVKVRLDNKNLLARATDQVRSAMSITNSRYGIVTDSKEYFIYDRNKKEEDFVRKSFDEIIHSLLRPEEIRVNEPDRQLVLEIIKKSAHQFLNNNTSFLNFIDSDLTISQIQFNQKESVFFLSDESVKKGEIDKFENIFFNKILGDFIETTICRYSSFKTIFDMISYFSFRMNGLAGMNDKTEVNYVESYLNKVEKPYIKELPENIEQLNRRYITSCSNIKRKDDLTLWRLYSEDGTGVCLIFTVDKTKLNENVFINKVKYADRANKHAELEFLKQIKEDVEATTGFAFEFKKLGYWKHFFKPYDYSVEEEIRLLIIDDDSLPKIKTDWVMTYTHSIINPIIDFQLNNSKFPIKLNGIMLGPKCPEQEINMVQLREMIRKKSIDAKLKGVDIENIQIELSGIKHYR